MAYKILLDAGHGGEDPGAVAFDRQEKDDTLRLVLAVGKILEQNGVEVAYTRTTDRYQTPFEKAQIANQSGADYFISIHRNSSPQLNQYAGVETLVYNDVGTKVKMAENINKELEKVGFENLGVKERPGLVVLRRTRIPAILVEVGFINSEADNARFDSKFQEIAQAIADGILMTLKPELFETAETYYRVQVGAYRMRQNADNLLYELQEKGYPAFLLNEDGVYKVQVGAYRQLANAITMERTLRMDGYRTFITT